MITTQKFVVCSNFLEPSKMNKNYKMYLCYIFLYFQLLVGATCHSVDHPLCTNRLFDYCIVEEASQIPLPLSLAPLRLASRFVLVGDHHQLPPLVRSPIAK